jgi:two-component system, NtrC family, response regulator HydG
MSVTPDAAVKARILIVEDDETISRLLTVLLTTEGYIVRAVGSAEEAMTALADSTFELVLLDLHLPGMSGIDLLRVVSPLHPGMQFVMMTAFGSVETAVEAMRLGAFHYLTKPLRTEELRLTLERAVQVRDLRREVAELRQKVGEVPSSRIIGKSPPMRQMLELVARVAPTRATVLILGETGTGKELVARALHDLSDRSRKPFLPVQCSALSESLLESELFGHVKGSFTGATQDRRGFFEEAHGGTLFLDEIATFPATVQTKLLRVLQERQVIRIGASKPIATDFRLVVATNEDLKPLVAAGQFREDLFYRLNVCTIRVPPLRDRIEDIPLLVSHFRTRVAEEIGVPALPIPQEEMERLLTYSWPGNVRELEHCVERAVIMGVGGSELHFDPSVAPADVSTRPLLDQAVDEEWSLARLEREYTLRILQKTGGHKNQAAEILQMDRRTLYRKLREYGIDQPPSNPHFVVSA